MAFSALGRAVWDETNPKSCIPFCPFWLSVLSVEPYGMKPSEDDARAHVSGNLSVLSVEPYGMKLLSALPLPLFSPLFQCSRSSRMG